MNENINSFEIIERYFEDNPDELVRPHKLWEKLPENIRNKYKPNTIRKECAQVERKGNIEKVKLSDTKVYYGSEEAIDQFNNQLGKFSDEVENRKRVIDYLLENNYEVFSYNDIMEKLDIKSQKRMIKMAVKEHDSLDMMSINNKYYFGTNQAIDRLKDRVDDAI